MDKKCSLGDRMKSYESISKNFLMRRMPAIIRLDGCHFHSYTKGFEKPFDKILMSCMQETMKYLCENIEGCVLGYTQSDEITLILCDYKKLTTDAWFGYNVEKMTSVSASLATFAFMRKILDIISNSKSEPDINFLTNKLNKGAFFDSRVFSLSKEEVNNCLVWRQQDAVRNSIQSLAQKYFSQKELTGLKTNELQNKLFNERGINWNDIETSKKRGSCCIKKENDWYIDNEIPIFSQDKEYINSRITF